MISMERGEPLLEILLVEDNDAHATAIKKYISRSWAGQFSLERATQLKVAVDYIRKRGFDAILLDLSLPDSDIQDTLDRTLEVAKHIPIIILSSLEDQDIALQSVHKGAQEFLCKSELNGELLTRTIRHAIERGQTEARQRALLQLGERALNDKSLDLLLAQSMRVLNEFLTAQCIGVFVQTKDQSNLLLSHGMGWQEGTVGKTYIASEPVTAYGKTVHFSAQDSSRTVWGLQTKHGNKVYSSESLDKWQLFKQHGLRCGMCAIVEGRKRDTPYGFLGVYYKTKRTFTASEADFLQSVANTIAGATKRIGLETRLKAKIAELDDLHRKKDEFLATLSHELRTPLNVIMGYSDLLMSADPNSQVFHQAVQAIHKSAHDETQLVADLLEVSRIITGRMKLTLTMFPVERVIRGALNAIEIAAKAKDIALSVILDPNVSYMEGDEGRLQQVLWNLLSNAVKFTPKHGCIDLYVKRIGSTIEIAVADTGQGINPENLPHLFNRFWQEDSSNTRMHSGLGLGLAIVRHIVELHGGTVAGYSKGHGFGSKFVVSLPVVSLHQDRDTESTTEHAIQSDRQQQGGLPKRLAGKNILIVDDNESNLRLIEWLVKKEGAQVTAVTSPKEGLEIAKCGGFDVLLCDIGMPELNGYEFIKRLRDWEESQSQSWTPAIALTAYASFHDYQTSINSGFQNHVAKPFRSDQLAKAIYQVI